MSDFYKNIRGYIYSEHAEALQILQKVFERYSIKYFLIGAQARDVHFFRKGIKPMRATKDIDFAVMLKDMNSYNNLFEELVLEGFVKTKEPYRLNWSKGATVVDILPFGQIEENFTINFDQREIELLVLGYQEVSEELEEYFIDSNETMSIPVPPIHGLFLLKLLSWDETKPDREKDLNDLSQILNNYWEFVEDEAYVKHLDLFDDELFSIQKASARILGRHLKVTMDKSSVLNERVVRILSEQAQQIMPPGLMLRKFAFENDQTIEKVKMLLEEILKGIED